MEFIKRIYGYKWATLGKSNEAVNACNLHHGIPVSEESITRNWINPILDETGFYYIEDDISLKQVLGNPVSFDVRKNDLA